MLEKRDKLGNTHAHTFLAVWRPSLKWVSHYTDKINLFFPAMDHGTVFCVYGNFFKNNSLTLSYSVGTFFFAAWVIRICFVLAGKLPFRYISWWENIFLTFIVSSFRRGRICISPILECGYASAYFENSYLHQSDLNFHQSEFEILYLHQPDFRMWIRISLFWEFVFASVRFEFPSVWIWDFVFASARF